MLPQRTVHFTKSGELMVPGNGQEAVAELAELTKDWIVSFLNCIGCGACAWAGSFMVIAGERAKVRRRFRESLDALRQVVALCPVNSRGMKECMSLRQDS